ncbi:MAG: hypothetical protein RL026_2135 [Pseudomonadota bacterium]|jgi:hypothetical protein
MTTRKPPSLLTLTASALVGASVAGAGYLLGQYWRADPALHAWSKGIGAALTVWDVLALPVLVLLVLAVHEIGHLLGGLSRGMRFLLLIIGPFQWHASATGVQFQWVRNLGLMGGLAATLPTRLGPGLGAQMATMIAGGPLASLLLAVAAAALVTSGEGRLAAYGLFVVVASTGIFLVTGIPLRTGGFMSDGMQLVDLLRGHRSVIERTQLLHLSAQSLAGVRPRDWTQHSVDNVAALGSSEPLRRIASWQLLLYRAMDCRDPTQVEHFRGLLKEHVEAFPDGFRQAIHVELALLASLAGDAATARVHLARAQGGVVEKSRRHLAEAALARLEGRNAEAAQQVRLAARHLPGAMDAGLARLTRDQLTQVA